jgi:hypothetical protein
MSRAYGWLHYASATPRSLGVLRAAVFGLWMVLFSFDVGERFKLAEEFHNSRGLIRLIPDFLQERMFAPGGQTLLGWIYFPLVGAAMLGLRPWRLWGPLALGCILWFESINKGFGEYVSHGHGMLLLGALVLTGARAADGFALGGKGAAGGEKAELEARFAVLVFTVGSLLCYTFIAGHRFTVGRVEVFAGEALRTWFLLRSQEPHVWFDYGLWVANTPWAMGLMKVIFISAFHGLCLLTMNLFFWENTILLWLLFLPLGRWLGRERDEAS